MNVRENVCLLAARIHLAHFDRVNDNLQQEGNPLRYKFTFLTERNLNGFFQSLRGGKIADFRSELDVKLAETE
jgi:hypothetical protein